MKIDLSQYDLAGIQDSYHFFFALYISGQLNGGDGFENSFPTMSIIENDMQLLRKEFLSRKKGDPKILTEIEKEVLEANVIALNMTDKELKIIYEKIVNKMAWNVEQN